MTMKAGWKNLCVDVTQNRRSLWGVLLLAGVVRGILFAMHLNDGIKDADEAIVGLMAKHIAEGSDFPLMWYGQQYMGTLPSWISAAIFAITGVSSNAVRIVPLLVSMGVVFMVYTLGSDLFGHPVGLLSGLWIAVCPPFLAIFSLKQANYMVTILLGTSLLWLTYHLCWSTMTIRRRQALIAVFGGIIGIGIWIHMQILPYAAAALGYLLWQGRRRITSLGWGLLIGGLALGSSPLIVDNVWQQRASLKFFFDSFQRSDPQVVSSIGSRIYNCLVVGFPTLLGGAPFWSFHWAGFTWRLPPILDDAVFISVLMLLMTLLVGFSLVLGWRQRAQFGGPRVQQAVMIVGAPVTVLFLAVWWLFGRYLGEFGALLWHDAIQWNQFEGAPMLTPAFLVHELSSAGMLIYLLYVPALLYSAALLHNQSQERRAVQLLLLTLLLVVGSYVGTRYGDARSPRYLMPAYSLAPIFLALLTRAIMRRLKLMGWLLITAVLAIHLLGFLEIPAAYHVQPAQYINWWNPEQAQLLPASNDPLIRFLQARRIGHVYAKYWLGMPLLFDSEETILVSAGRTGRYPRYDDEVAQAERVAYIFHRNGFEWQGFEHLMHTAGIAYHREPLAEYVVYVDVALPDRLNSPLWPKIVGLLQYP